MPSPYESFWLIGIYGVTESICLFLAWTNNSLLTLNINQTSHFLVLHYNSVILSIKFYEA